VHVCNTLQWNVNQVRTCSLSATIDKSLVSNSQRQEDYY